MASSLFTISADGLSASSPDGLQKDMQPSIGLRQYIGGRENALVSWAVPAVLDPLEGFQPVVFFGASGTGKTLLVCSLIEQWKRRHPNRSVLASSGADLARAVADAAETGSAEEFRRRYRRAGLVVVDGLQELADKPTAQAELAYLIAFRARRNQSTLLTSRMPPFERGLTNRLASRLASRLVAGLTIPLKQPGQAARQAILQRLAQLHQLSLPVDVIQMLLTHEQLDSVNQLHGFLLQLKLSLERDPSPVDATRITTLLEQRPPSGQLSTASIAMHVARHFRLRIQDLKGRTRRRSVAQARAMAMYLARHLTGESFGQIGFYFGGRDHTTVIHAVRTVQREVQQDPDKRHSIQRLTEELNGRSEETVRQPTHRPHVSRSATSREKAASRRKTG